MRRPWPGGRDLVTTDADANGRRGARDCHIWRRRGVRPSCAALAAQPALPQPRETNVRRLQTGGMTPRNAGFESLSLKS